MSQGWWRTGTRGDVIKLWLKAPVEERDSDGKRRMTGGKNSTRGTPQGGVASPLLSVIYMNRLPDAGKLSELMSSPMPMTLSSSVADTRPRP